MVKYHKGFNKITEEIYYRLKAELRVPADDYRVIYKYRIGKTTAQNIRNTKNYEEYLGIGTTVRQNRNKLDGSREGKTLVIIGNKAEPNPLTRTLLIFAVACGCVAATSLAIAIAKWAFNLYEEDDKKEGEEGLIG